jgi:predicted metal-dependent phosphoesterase TrpH
VKMKLDLHVHTANSKDAFTKTDQLATLCKLKGLDGVAITDHNKLCESLPPGLKGVRGMEISSLDGHIIGLGLQGPVPRGLTGDQTIEEIHALGGVAIIPHPYDLFRSSVNPGHLSALPDAIEVINASSILHSISWAKARTFAKANNIPAVAGSDSHIPQTLGTAYTIIENDGDSETEILDAIRSGEVTPNGRTIRLGQRLRKLMLQAGRKKN